MSRGGPKAGPLRLFETISIGSIDLPCLIKLNGPRQRGKLRGRQRGFKRLWRLVVECRMQPITIVVPLQKLLDLRTEILDVSILVSIDLFQLERFHEALAR